MTSQDERDELEEMVRRRIVSLAEALLEAIRSTNSEDWSAARAKADVLRPTLTLEEQNRAQTMALRMMP
jgi:hypothetical protein